MRTPSIKIGLPLRLIVWLARFPDEELSSSAIRSKFGHVHVHQSLRKYVSNGLLCVRDGPRQIAGGGTQTEAYYSAGERLQTMIRRYEVS